MQEHETRHATCHPTPAQSSCHETMHAGGQSSAPIMKLLCHKTSASQECCCDTCKLLTQGLNIEPHTHAHKRAHTHTHTHTHTHLNCKKGGSFNRSSTGWSKVCIYLSTLAGCVLCHLPTVVGFVKAEALALAAARCSTV